MILTLSDRARQARVRNVASHVPPFGIPTDFRADSEPSPRAKKAPTSGPNEAQDGCSDEGKGHIMARIVERRLEFSLVDA